MANKEKDAKSKQTQLKKNFKKWKNKSFINKTK